VKEDLPRVPGHAKDPGYEALLARLNTELAALPRSAAAAPRRPVLFIVGVPRSGTTLLHQLLAATGSFGHVSNLVARFPARPGFGARIERLLAPLLPAAPVSYSSAAGKTSGWREPHEFGYFWQRHFRFAEHHELDAAALAGIDRQALCAELAELEEALDRPLLLKNLLLAFCCEFLAELLPTARFVCVWRAPLQVADSLLRTRRMYYGTEQAWFSARPADVASLLDAPPAVQVAHQIAAVSRALGAARDRLGPERWLDLAYPALCAAPRAQVARIATLAGITAAIDELPAGFPLAEKPSGPVEELRRALEDRGLEPDRTP
jgi:hypothetical protein